MSVQELSEVLPACQLHNWACWVCRHSCLQVGKSGLDAGIMSLSVNRPLVNGELEGKTSTSALWPSFSVCKRLC